MHHGGVNLRKPTGGRLGSTEQEPFGHAGQRLHQWMFATAMGARIFGRDDGTTGVDNALAVTSWQGIRP